ncbi:hypothetical protein HN512_04480 [Candidatus Peregrinibacteria bacterium]|jgi:ribosome-binding factor A|nr:hypothetical protein [Candidatus Peregrinibacteria bacterium]MBT3599063.1 hypothetical protein [Candidatus Peregrinibacteria bacterium]MBT4366767.1 hypothetical protein [Candidatus Peregrinibacteria bacterium]MBT4585677.1 hypothetical protein [Candidatus Peregrinibacteria bacterium]MBT6730631.1 hypothetical protein [Candidatus Peregrinibacteria bacterium]
MSKRPKMLASVIRDIISPVLRECPQECGIVSMTEVDVSDDFSHATIYISSFKETEVAIKYLKKRIPFLQRQVGAINRSRVPALRFKADERTERGNRIDELLR